MRSRFCTAKGRGRVRKDQACRWHACASLALALAVLGASASPGFSESWWEKMMRKGAPAEQPAPAAPAGAPNNAAPAAPNDAQPAVSGPAIQVVLPKVQNVSEYIELTGNAASVNTVKLIARVEGYLDQIHFLDGSIVKKGDLLFTIQQEQYKAQLAQAEAQVRAQEAALFYANTEVKRYTALAEERRRRTGRCRQLEFSGEKNRSRTRFGQGTSRYRQAQSQLHGGAGAVRRADGETPC